MTEQAKEHVSEELEEQAQEGVADQAPEVQVPEEQMSQDSAEEAAPEVQMPRKPMKYYIDFENVHGPGLKGVDALSPDDQVLVFYSQAAETFHIEHAIDLLNSKAKIEFIEIDGGTRNSLDFQLVAALFGMISDEYGYAIVSGDGGFDAAIKMGQRLGLPEVVRIVNIKGETELPAKTRSRRSRSTKSSSKDQVEPTQQEAAEQEETKPAKTRSRRTRSSKSTTRSQTEASQQEPAQHETLQQEAPELEGEAKPAKTRTRRSRSSKSEASQPEASKSEASKSEVPQPEVSQPEALQSEAKDQVEGTQPEAPAQGSAEEQSAEKPEAESAEQAKPSNGNGRRRGSRGSGKSGKREEVAALLANNGIEIDQRQLSTIMQALNGAKKRQDFYRRIIQLEKQERGLALYREVRDFYEPLLNIVKA